MKSNDVRRDFNLESLDLIPIYGLIRNALKCEGRGTRSSLSNRAKELAFVTYHTAVAYGLYRALENILEK